MSGPDVPGFVAPTITGYNATPPADDGSQVIGNQLKWSYIKDKLADPVKTLLDQTIVAISGFAAQTINTTDGVANSIASNIGFAPDLLTIAAGIIVPNRTYHTIETEGATSTDNLDTITNTDMDPDAILILRADNTAHDIVIRHIGGGTGNILLSNGLDLTFADDIKSICLQRRGNNWYELFRSGGAGSVQTFDASGTWIKGTGTYGLIECWGAGASGGGRTGTASSGGGGGGGGYSSALILLSSLSATETVTIGAGGVAIAINTGTSGNTGGNTTFGTKLTGFGGGPGTTSATAVGGGGGSPFSAGLIGTAASASGAAGGGGGAAVSSGAGASNFMGGSGGYASNNGGAGILGGGGGAGEEGATGGSSIMGGGGGGKTTGGTSQGAGVGGALGGAGVQPGGGGGPGNNVNASGKGGDGRCRVTLF